MADQGQRSEQPTQRRMEKGRREGNFPGSRELIERILVSEEEHLDWLETQIHLVESIGEAHYLAQHVHD